MKFLHKYLLENHFVVETSKPNYYKTVLLFVYSYVKSVNVLSNLSINSENSALNHFCHGKDEVT